MGQIPTESAGSGVGCLFLETDNLAQLSDVGSGVMLAFCPFQSLSGEVERCVVLPGSKIGVRSRLEEDTYRLQRPPSFELTEHGRLCQGRISGSLLSFELVSPFEQERHDLRRTVTCRVGQAGLFHSEESSLRSNIGADRYEKLHHGGVSATSGGHQRGYRCISNGLGVDVPVQHPASVDRLRLAVLLLADQVSHIQGIKSIIDRA